MSADPVAFLRARYGPIPPVPTTIRSKLMDLTEAERLLRAHADDTVPVPVLYDKERTAIVLVLAELERLRSALAEESGHVSRLVAANEELLEDAPGRRTMPTGEEFLREFYTPGLLSRGE